MKRNRLWLLSVVLLVLLAFSAEAQKPKTKKPVKKVVQKTPAQKQVKPQKEAAQSDRADLSVAVSQDEKKVRDIVTFLQYMLNTLGSSGTSTRDKDVLVTESYSKIFSNNKVQIEDDLDEERNVITNKDIVAYLKDVDFFFKDVKFEFTIEKIESSTLPSGDLFYKVSLSRNLNGTNTDGKTVNNTLPRFIEVNYNPKDQDLKIVSIYTNEFNEREALTNWWKELSFEWQTIFKGKLTGRPVGDNLKDSVQLSDIKNITSIEELDLSNNTYIQTIEPLGQLLNLKSLRLSGSNVNDLTPIRNLTELVELDLSRTKINDLSPLKYSNKLLKLNISHTDVIDILVIEKMPELQHLDMSETSVIDFTPIGSLTKLVKVGLAATKISNLTPFEKNIQLSELDITGTFVQDLNPLKNLKNLHTLNIDSTSVINISALSSMENLNVLSANYTSISDLLPLQKLLHLEKIYCDQTPINRDAANKFMAANPKVLVIFDSKDLKIWWSSLSSEWQKVLSATAKIGPTPLNEELAKIPLLDSINLGGNGHIDNIEPLRKLQKLETIIAYKTGITDLAPLRGHTEIKYLDISETDVSDISYISQFKSLKVLRADKSKIENIEGYLIPSLEKFYADQTAVHDIIAKEFLEKNPRTLLIYKTIHLERWWNNLTESWKEVFAVPIGSDTGLRRENLHKLVEQEALHFKDVQVGDLSALSEFVRLKELHFSGTSITTIPSLENIRSLKSLHATNSPIQHIESLSLLSELEELDISNTPIEDLKVIGSLQKLRYLNCSGTQIRRLDPVEKLENIEYLDCSNTNVSKLDPLQHLHLKTLKCYNTKISKRAIENFKASHPECNVIYYR